MLIDDGLISMPMIRPVEATEQLEAQGCYHYYRNDEKMPVLEPWTLHALADGRRVMRCCRDASSYGNQILVHSIQSGNVISRFELQWNKVGGDKPQRIFADYRFSDNSLEVTRTAVDGEVKITHQDLDPGCVISPLMRIYSGAVTQQLLKAGKSQVLVPWIRDPDDSSRLLEPLLSEREAYFQAEEIITVAGKDYQSRRYEYFGGEYHPGTLFWLDEYDVLLRYRWQQDENTVWEKNLEDYRR